MKKIIVMSLVLVLSLITACGKNNNSNFTGVDTTQGDNRTQVGNSAQGGNSTQVGNSAQSGNNAQGGNNGSGDIDFEAIFAGTSDIKLNNLSESEKQAIIDAGEAAGVTVLFTDIDDVVFFTRLSDEYNAAWTLDGWTVWSDSDSALNTAEWPDDEFTRLITKPDFDLFLTNTYEDTFTAVFRNVTLAQIKTYTESVKTAGFTVNPELDEKTTYKYTASNGKGYSIELTRYTGSDQTVYLIITNLLWENNNEPWEERYKKDESHSKYATDPSENNLAGTMLKISGVVDSAYEGEQASFWVLNDNGNKWRISLIGSGWEDVQEKDRVEVFGFYTNKPLLDGMPNIYLLRYKLNGTTHSVIYDNRAIADGFEVMSFEEIREERGYN